MLCVLGPPGAGKTTISLRLAESTGAELVVVSRFLRGLIEQDPAAPVAKYIQENFNSGSNIDKSEIHSALMERLDSIDASSIILDGFPRTRNAQNCLNEWMSRTNRKLVVLHVFADIGTCRQRFQSKNLDTRSQEAFDARSSHYATVERGLISEFSNSPIININTTG